MSGLLRTNRRAPARHRADVGVPDFLGPLRQSPTPEDGLVFEGVCLLPVWRMAPALGLFVASCSKGLRGSSGNDDWRSWLLRTREAGPSKISGTISAGLPRRSQLRLR